MEALDIRLSRLLEEFKTDDLDENTINEEVEKIRKELHFR